MSPKYDAEKMDRWRTEIEKSSSMQDGKKEKTEENLLKESGGE